MKEITQEYLKELFDYKNGNLFWKINHQGIQKGNKAGTICHGYYQIGINYKVYLTHRLIYLYHYGFLPKEIDHIDRDKSNNNIENLRESTRSQNGMNKKSNKNSTSKYKGVYWNKHANKWHVQIKINKKLIYLGLFTDELKAAITYNEKAIELFGEYACLNEVK